MGMEILSFRGSKEGDGLLRARHPTASWPGRCFWYNMSNNSDAWNAGEKKVRVSEAAQAPVLSWKIKKSVPFAVSRKDPQIDPHWLQYLWRQPARRSWPTMWTAKARISATSVFCVLRWDFAPHFKFRAASMHHPRSKQPQERYSSVVTSVASVDPHQPMRVRWSKQNPCEWACLGTPGKLPRWWACGRARRASPCIK